MLTAPHVHAGTYVGLYTDPGTLAASPYTGGTYIVPDQNGTPQSFPDKIGTTQGFAAGYGGDSGGVTASCTGAITVAWKWVPASGQTMMTDPPPTQVIISESCSVEVTVVSPMATGSYDTGMGEQGTVSWSPGGNNTRTASHVRYSVLAGAPILKLPSVNASAVAAAAGNSSSLRYAAALYPVTINIIGTNNPYAGDFRALTGQQITASLGAPYGLPNGTKVTGYTWSFSNNNPIKYWDPTAPGDGQLTQIIPLGPTDYIGFPPIGSSTVSVSPISFYDEIAGDTVTVKCAVTLILPDHSTPTINAASPLVTFLKPAVTKWDVVTGFVQRVTDPKTGYYGYGLEPVSSSNGNYGEIWNNVTINVLPPFYGGQGCFVQLITPNTTITNKNPAMSPVFPGNGQLGLDNSFPYKSYIWPVPSLGGNADGPALVCSAYNSPVDQGFTTVAVDGKFSTWVMYKPPAVSSQGTIWVPLQSYSWEWSFTSKWDGSLWNLWRASPASTADDPHYQPTGVMNSPPRWDTIQTNSK